MSRMPGLVCTISVVDDEAPVRKALGRLLRASGFGVETFATGREFLDSLSRRHPDCAILDLHLPGLSGLEVQAELRRTNSGVPCIVITGKDEPGIEERVLASGAAIFLRKPLDAETLLAAIARAVPRLHLKTEPNGTRPGSAQGQSTEQTHGGHHDYPLN